jgi:predicted phage-related endonuclease
VNGFQPKDDNLAMYLGREMEPILRDLFFRETGLKVKQDNKIRIHDDHPFITTNLDGMVVGEKVPVEFKTTSQKWDGEIPDHYFVQLQHQMMVTDAPYIYFASLSLGYNKQMVIEKYHRDDKFIKSLMDTLVEFWKINVEGKVAPQCQTIGDANLLYSTVSEDEIAQADDDIYNIAVQLRACNSRKSEFENEIKKLKLQLMTVLEDKQVLEYNGHQLATWKKTKDSERFDKESFKKDHPEIYAKYISKKAGFRRFVLKKEL